MNPDATAPESSPTRCGFLVLAGPPNVGKSTLLNAVVGERLSIVGPRARTTWQRVRGILTRDALQMVVVDTPGIVAGTALLDRSMIQEVESAVAMADSLVVVLDGTTRTRPDTLEALKALAAGARGPRTVVANKSDRAAFDPAPARRFAMGIDASFFVLAARAGRGIDRLLGHLAEQMPPGPFLYPAEDLAPEPVRFFVREFIREAIFAHYRQEIPHAVGVRIEEFREGEDPLYIAASLHVERKSQKGMVIGRKGERIRALGTDARRRIEGFLGRRVYLDLRVKISPGWRRTRKGLAMFGYRVPD